jgi:hypothetical protein
MKGLEGFGGGVLRVFEMLEEEWRDLEGVERETGGEAQLNSNIWKAALPIIPSTFPPNQLTHSSSPNRSNPTSLSLLSHHLSHTNP